MVIFGRAARRAFKRMTLARPVVGVRSRLKVPFTARAFVVPAKPSPLPANSR